MIYRRLYTYPTRTPARMFGEWERVRQQMNRMMDQFWGQELPKAGANVFPPVNLTEDANHYRVRAELPGIGAENLDIQVTGKSLSISGERKIAHASEGARYHRRERESGKFSRMFSLPGEVDGERTEAKLDNGILTIVIPKAEAAKPRQITVK